VAGEDGISKSATTSMTNTDGWFKFSASGFTHSAPTILVKLSSSKNDLKVYLKKLNLVKKGTVTSRSKLLQISGLKYVSTSKWSIQVSTPKICKVSGTGIKNVAKGTCKMVVYVTPKATKKVPRPIKKSAKISLVVS
jgi:hypothetical protein